MTCNKIEGFPPKQDKKKDTDDKNVKIRNKTCTRFVAYFGLLLYAARNSTHIQMPFL